ncbi:T9SS type A sorting domain-containing protein [Snuella sedimenti]|uniref:T9SS type A sorting domain-containing protein n=1 Tax=Snuella sedimenti TaxID=2798802 RepID=A0A8J7IJ49_9FLAO|nr:T9SS type A sorting domain-containing protein [Snuella sedimenti]MBJ6369211.1 T9SS type A sorting domain-containing protein [Snuella sedimenti]
MYSFTKLDIIGCTNKSFKRLLLCCLVIVFGLSTQFFYGQDVGSSSVQANFGVDGDVYSGVLQFPPNFGPALPTATGTADWFENGTGLGVIDELGSANGGNPDSDPNPPNSVDNVPVELRQSVWIPNALPIPFPVVVEDNAGVPTPYLWLDAVYGRDTYVKGGSAETSYFSSGADKNSDNPVNWSIGTMGSVPQKTDIVDVYAHLRGTNPHDPATNPGFPLDDRPFDELYAFAGASLVVTNGNKHLDFEFFREGLETPADLSDPSKLGPDGGRTAWTFDTDGTILIPGTIIVSVDYINGGNVPDIRIRVWMEESVFNAYDNTAVNRPFNVDKGVAFEKGTGSGNFGYAAINPAGGGTNMWGRANNDFVSDATSMTLGPPWSTWEGSGPSLVTNYQRYQFVEIAINLTAFGLDRRGMQDPCSNILGSLLVKTRSSGGGPNESAFGSELKDFAGPYLFGFLGGPPEIVANNLADCEIGDTGEATFDLETAIDEGNSTPEPDTTRTFHESMADADNLMSSGIANPNSYSATNGTVIWIRSVRTGSQCYSKTSFTLTVYDNPEPTGNDLDDCESGADNGMATFNLNDGVNQDGGSVSFHLSQADADNDANPIANPAAYETGNDRIYVRNEVDNGNGNVCYGTTFFDITVYDNPDPTGNDLDDCESGADNGMATFNLNDGVNQDGGSVSFHLSQADADNDVNPIANPAAYETGSDRIYVRNENDADGDNDCYGTTFFDITVYDNPDPTGNDLDDCESGADNGMATFDLNDGVNQDGGSVSFHLSQADADNDANPIANPAAYETGSDRIYVRNENDADGDNDCYGTTFFDITVYDNPDPTGNDLAACEDGTNQATFNLNDGVNQDGGSVSFHLSQADADNDVNPIANPAAYLTGSDRIYVRNENDNDGDNDCYGTTFFDITVFDDPAPTGNDLDDCESGADNGMATFDLNDGVNTAGGSVSFHLSQADADNDANPIANPAAYETGNDRIYVRNEIDNGNGNVCYGTTFFDITVYDNPDPTGNDLDDCESGADNGMATFNLNDGVNQDGGSVSFHLSQADADNDANPIANPAAYETGSDRIYVRNENDADGDNDCYGTTFFDITVYDNPDPTGNDLADCESGADNGMATFDLNDGVNQDGGSVSFHLSQADADNDANPIANPAAYETGNDRIYVRNENDNDGDNDCYGTTFFDITVYDNPDPTAMNLADCESGDDTQTFDLDDGVTGEDGGTISFHTSQSDANSGSNPIAGKDAYSVSVGDSPKTIYVRSHIDNGGGDICYGTTSFTITVYDNPPCNITGDNVICSGESASFTASGGTSYSWTGPGGFTANTATISGLTVPGEYEVTVTDGNNCSSTCSRTLTVDGTEESPAVTPTAYCEDNPPASLCPFATTDVAGADIVWLGYIKDGGSFVPINSTVCPDPPTVPGVYAFFVEIDTNDNCITESGAFTEIEVYPLPTVEAGDPPLAICNLEGNFVQLTGSPVGGTWSGSPYITADGLFTVPTGGIPAGNYTVTYTYTDGNGCTNSDTVDIPVVVCTECGTAFGVAVNGEGAEAEIDTGISTCFRENGFHRWGWTNKITPSWEPYVLDLYRGAGKCLLNKGEYVGTVTINYSPEDYTITALYEMAPGIGLSEAHLYIGCDAYPTGKNGAYTVAPGQYTFNAGDLSFVMTWSTSTDAEKTITVPGGGAVYVIAHAVACSDVSGEVAPNGFVPTTDYGEFQENPPATGYDGCIVDVDPWGKADSVKAYPVPFENEVNISYKFDYDTDVKIKVYDIKGALLRQAENRRYIKSSVGNTRFDLSRTDDQMYFVRVTTARGSVVKKIVSSKHQK